jgi:threonine dehydrogenase-like Zn-dependent dehydrogenase
MARLASRCGLGKVIVVGRHEFRLRQVPSAIAIHEQRTPGVPQAIRDANDGRGVDVSILATGSASAVELGLASLRARGRLVVFSAVHGTPAVDWFRLHTQELNWRARRKPA